MTNIICSYVIFFIGGNPQMLLPPMNILLEGPELRQLLDNANFQFLIKAAYEYISRTQMMDE